MSTKDGFPRLDPEIAAIVSSFPAPAPGPRPTVQEIRASEKTYFVEARKWQSESLPTDSEYKVEDRMVPVDDGENLARCLIPTPKDADPAQTYPLVVWFHGGGYMVGSVEMDGFFLRYLCVKHRVVIVNVEYRLAPEHPFPTPVNDGYEGLKWAVSSRDSLHASPKHGLIVGGCSAGGNLTASTVLRARDDPFFSDSPITGKLLQFPAIVHPDATIPEKYGGVFISATENAHVPCLTRADLIYMAAALKAEPNDPWFSVLLAPSHAILPPTYLQIAGADPMRDEGLTYGRVLQDAGVETKLDLYDGFPHGGNYVFPRVTLSQKFHKDFDNGLAWLLRR